MSGKLYCTKHGLAKLRQEIDRLTRELEHLESQTAHVAEVGGNQYHDNASYEALVIDIRGVDHRLKEAHDHLNRAVLVESPSTTDRVAIGTRVTIRRDGETETWEIVGFGESDPDRKWLAYNTPLASLLAGKRKGDVISGVIGGKQTKIEILDIALGVIDEDAK